MYDPVITLKPLWGSPGAEQSTWSIGSLCCTRAIQRTRLASRPLRSYSYTAHTLSVRSVLARARARGAGGALLRHVHQDLTFGFARWPLRASQMMLMLALQAVLALTVDPELQVRASATFVCTRCGWIWLVTPVVPGVLCPVPPAPVPVHSSHSLLAAGHADAASAASAASGAIDRRHDGRSV